MLVTSQGTTAGAVSGGCVERAVAARAKRVLQTQAPEMLVYDGRHRLGCNGSLHILLEPLAPSDPEAFFAAFTSASSVQAATTQHEVPRRDIHLTSVASVPIEGDEVSTPDPAQLGTQFRFGETCFAARPTFELDNSSSEYFIYQDTVHPSPRLIVIGTEYDATVLAQLGAAQGYQTTLVTHPRNPLSDLANVTVLPIDPAELLDQLYLDARAAVVLMSHNYARDLAYLRSLAGVSELAYLGLLGPARRRDQLLNDLTETHVDLPDWMLSNVYGPAGIDLGGELPEQIALSIMAEIVAVANERPVPSLRDKRGNIHEPVAR